MATVMDTNLSPDQAAVFDIIRRLHSVGLRATYEAIVPHSPWRSLPSVQQRCKELADLGLVHRASRGTFEPTLAEEGSEGALNHNQVAAKDAAHPQGDKEVAA